MKTKILISTLLLASILAACSPAYSSTQSQSNQAAATPTTSTAPIENTATEMPAATQTTEPMGNIMDFNVEISGFAFVENNLTIHAGDTVTWTNHDSTSHSVVADDGSFKSGTLSNDGTFSFTFTTPGTYTYHCGFHSSMTGTVIVQP